MIKSLGLATALVAMVSAGPALAQSVDAGDINLTGKPISTTNPMPILVTPSISVPTHTSGTTSATAGVSSTISAAGSLSRGMVVQNTCGTAEWLSSSVAVATPLTQLNSITLAPGAIFITPDWYPVSGAWTIASATAVACTYSADFK